MPGTACALTHDDAGPASSPFLAAQIFLQKHASAKGESLVSGNSMFFRMHRILDIYFVGGFGTVQFIDVDEYVGTRPDAIVMDHPHHTLQARRCQGLF